MYHQQQIFHIFAPTKTEMIIQLLKYSVHFHLDIYLINYLIK